jgi:hypothetical protein
MDGIRDPNYLDDIKDGLVVQYTSIVWVIQDRLFEKPDDADPALNFLFGFG